MSEDSCPGLKLTTDCSHRTSQAQWPHQNGHSYPSGIETQLIIPGNFDLPVDQLSEPSCSRTQTRTDILNNTYPFTGTQHRLANNYLNHSLTQGCETGREYVGFPVSDRTDLKLSLDCSHRKLAKRLQLNNSDFSGKYNVLFVNSKTEQIHDGNISDTESIKSDLQLSVDCSHRKHKTVLRPRNDLLTNGGETSCYNILYRPNVSTERDCNIENNPDTGPVISDLQLSRNCSHRNHHNRLFTSQSNHLGQYLETGNTQESDLHLSLNCSRRKHKHQLSLGNGLPTEYNAERDHRLVKDPCSKGDIYYLEPETADSDLQLSLDCSHRTQRQCLDVENTLHSRYRDGDQSLGSHSDPGLTMSFDCSHRRQSLSSVAEDGSHVASGSTDLRKAGDTSHRRSKIQPSLETDNGQRPLSVPKLGCILQNIDLQSHVNVTKDIQDRNQHLKLQNPKFSHRISFSKRKEEVENASVNWLNDEAAVAADKTSVSNEVLRENAENGLSQQGEMADLCLNSCENRQVPDVNFRKRRKRFRSGSDSNLVITCKKAAMGRNRRSQRLNNNNTAILFESDLEFGSKDCDNVLRAGADDNIASSATNKVTGTSETSKELQKDVRTVKGTCKLENFHNLKVHEPRGSSEKRPIKCLDKQRLWPGVDRKQQFIQRVHKAIARVDHNVGTSVPGINTDGNEDLNLSRLETIMPLNEENRENDRKAKHRFIRKSGVLYRRHDNGAIWETVVSKYVS